MQVQRVENNNYNFNFQALKISNAETWNGKVLNEFVHNFEVQKFVKFWHDQGIDIIASQQGKIGIAMKEASTKPDSFLIGIYNHNGGIKNFNAAEAISQIKNETKEKIENLPLISQAQEFVSLFNKALTENKPQNTNWEIK
jgi:hypothetical protein